MSKTAMQELIRWVDEQKTISLGLNDAGGYAILSIMKEKFPELLGKEKEQIVDAYRNGLWMGSPNADVYSQLDNDKTENYYSQTYKPKTNG